LRVVRTERELLKERLNAFKRKLFAAKSEVRGSEQKDLFFDEAESKRGPTPKFQKQLKRIAQLPRAQQHLVIQMLDGVLAQGGR
jgi:hypothetical protein